jgi:hypothetical protein
MTFSFDTGGGDGSQGPWIAWSARGTLDGTIPAKSFYLREGSDKQPFGGFSENGVVLDIHAMKTGWQRSEGVAGQAPDWRWNDTIAAFKPAPGDDYKKGFSIPCAIGMGKTATWEQAGAAAWNAFVALVPALQQAPAGDMLPLVKLTGSKLEQYKRGSTVIPVLEVVKWVPRPDCLKPDAARIATEPAPTAAPTPQPAQTAAPVPAGAEF